MIRAGWLVAVAWLFLPADASAQSGGFIHRLELTGAGGYFSGSTIGTADAVLRANSTTPQNFTVFSTDTRLKGSPVVDARVGVWISRRLSVEGRFGYGRPTLETSVSADAEGASPVTVVERIDQYVIDGGVLFRLDEVRLGRLVPYAAGGAGYLRRLHEGFALIEDGHLYHLGGGVTHDLAIRTHGVVRAAGLRADARMYFLPGDASVNGRSTRHGSFTAGVFVRF